MHVYLYECACVYVYVYVYLPDFTNNSVVAKLQNIYTNPIRVYTPFTCIHAPLARAHATHMRIYTFSLSQRHLIHKITASTKPSFWLHILCQRGDLAAFPPQLHDIIHECHSHEQYPHGTCDCYDKHHTARGAASCSWGGSFGQRLVGLRRDVCSDSRHCDTQPLLLDCSLCVFVCVRERMYVRLYVFACVWLFCWRECSCV